MNKRDEMFAKAPEVIGRAVVRAIAESKSMPETPREIRRKRYGNPLWLTLAVWIGWPLFIATIVGIIMIFTK